MSQRLPRTVVALGFVSFFNDLASEIVVPLVPILLATVLGAGPVALGLIEGVADAVAAGLRLWSGRHSDVMGGRRKGLVLAGYGLSNLARPLLALAGGWTVVLVLRAIDRVGKGIRSAPRDALVADVTPAALRGYAYGFQRALDNAGAVGGSLIAAAVLAWSDVGLQTMILLSALPGAMAVGWVVWGVQTTPSPSAPSLLGEEGRTTPSPSAPPLLDKEGRTTAPGLSWWRLGAPMRRFLVVLGLFTLARASETFIVLLGHERGMSAPALLVLWAVLGLAKAITATHGGRLADRLGRLAPIGVSWGALAASFALLAVLPGQPALWLVAIGYGLGAGIGEGAERALVGDFASARERGTAFGWYNFVVGLCAIPSGLLFGGLWHAFGAASAFATAAAIAAVAALLLWIWARPLARAR